jgi:hypothetical protein
MPQQKLYPLQIATALPAELMGWSAASTRLHLEYKRCTEEVFPCKYTDLGNAGFHLVGLNLRGEAVVRRKCSGTQLLQLTANSQVDLIGMEACAGATSSGERSASKGLKHGSSQPSTSSLT